MTRAEPDTSSSLPAAIFVIVGVAAVVCAIAVTTNSNESVARLGGTHEYAARSEQPRPMTLAEAGVGVADERAARLRRRLARCTVIQDHAIRRILSEFHAAPVKSPIEALWVVRTLTEFSADAREDVTVRRAAVAGLARFDREYLVDDPFVDRFTDRDAVVRSEAVFGRARHGLSGYIDAALHIATDGDARVRQRVAAALGTVQEARATDALLRLVFDDDRDVTRSAAKSLARTWRGPLPVRLIEAADSDDPATRLAVAITLTALKGEQSTNILASLSGDPDWQVRQHALNGLAKVGRKHADIAAARLIAVASDDSADRSDRYEAIQALAPLGETAQNAKITEIAVGSSDPLIQLLACRTALAHGDLRVLDALATLLDTKTGPQCDDEDMQFIHGVALVTLRDATGSRSSSRDPVKWQREFARLRTREIAELPTYRPKYLPNWR